MKNAVLDSLSFFAALSEAQAILLAAALGFPSIALTRVLADRAERRADERRRQRLVKNLRAALATEADLIAKVATSRLQSVEGDTTRRNAPFPTPHVFLASPDKLLELDAGEASSVLTLHAYLDDVNRLMANDDGDAEMLRKRRVDALTTLLHMAGRVQATLT